MKKKLIALALVLACSTNVYAANLRIDGILTNLETTNVSNYTMASMYDLFKELGITSRKDSDVITAKKDNTELVMTIGSTKAYINKELIAMPVAPYLEGETIKVPISFVSGAFNAKSDWDSINKMVNINTGKPQLSLLEMQTIKSATILTYEEALSKAIKNNTNLKNLIGSIDNLEDQRKTAEDSISEFNDTSQSTGYGRGSIATVLSGLKEVETTLDNITINEQKIKDATELTLKNYLSTIKGSELDLALLEKSIKLQEINVKNVELKNSLGLESETNLTAAKRNLEQSNANFNTLKLNLENQRIALNSFLGLKAEDKIYIEYATKLVPVKVDLKQYTNTKLNNDPEILLKKASVENVEYTIKEFLEYSKYTINPSTGEILSTDTTDVKLNMNLNIAQRAYDDTKKGIETAITQTYNQLKQVEERDASLRLNLEAARDVYNNAVTSYSAGMITYYDVEQAKLGILQAEVEIVKNIDQYNLLQITFEHPYFAL